MDSPRCIKGVMLRGQRVWVLGAGYLGRILAERCREVGAQVLTIDSSPAAAADICADAADAEVLAHVLKQEGEPDYVFSCLATRGGTVEDYRRCYLGAVRALGTIGMAGRCVFCSSTSLYAGVTERNTVLQEAEQEILGAGGAVARLAPIYGPGRCELLRRHLAREPRLSGAPDRVLNYLHVQDAAEALLVLAVRGVKGVYPVSGEAFTKAEAYAMMERLSGIPAAAEDAPASKRGGTSEIIDTAQLRALGWQPSWRFIDFVRAAVPAPSE